MFPYNSIFHPPGVVAVWIYFSFLKWDDPCFYSILAGNWDTHPGVIEKWFSCGLVPFLLYHWTRKVKTKTDLLDCWTCELFAIWMSTWWGHDSISLWLQTDHCLLLVAEFVHICWPGDDATWCFDDFSTQTSRGEMKVIHPVWEVHGIGLLDLVAPDWCISVVFLTTRYFYLSSPSLSNTWPLWPLIRGNLILVSISGQLSRKWLLGGYGLMLSHSNLICNSQ